MDENKAVLILISGLTPYRIAFLEELSKEYQLNVLCELEISKDREWRVNIDITNNLNIHVMKNWFRQKNCAFCPEIIKYLKHAKGPILISGYSTPTGILSIIWLRLHKKPYILNADGGILKHESKLLYFLKRFCISGARYYLSTGKRTDEYFIYYGADSERITDYPFTSVDEKDLVKAPILTSEKLKIRDRLGIKEKKVIISVGQFIHRKGFDILLQADVLKDRSIGLYIIGGEPTKEYIKMKENMKLENVHFVGFKQKIELRTYYLAADMFVLPTREDIWGLVINEAMACALPVITTDNCVAGLELIENGENGYIVPVNNVEVLSVKIKQLINDNILLEKMSRSALQTIKMYTFQSMSKVHAELFDAYQKNEIED